MPSPEPSSGNKPSILTALLPSATPTSAAAGGLLTNISG